MVKNLPASQETPVGFLGSERSHGEGNTYPHLYSWGFPSGSDLKDSACSAKRPGFDVWVKKIPW